MLPFGSITSIVPLFVLAFAYLLYFSANTLNKNNADEKKVTEEKNQLNPGVNEIFLPDFRIVDDTESDELVNSAKVYPTTNFIISSFRLPPDGNTSPLHWSNCFSPRPPPVHI